ncbi:MAG: hypothetical protein SPK09_00740 [Porphyromonas sp.]|nr:hypothetical protein [Porphyromonas sp.]
MENDVKLFRALNAFREQAVKAWGFLSSLVRYDGYGVDNMAILDVKGKELPISPSEFELSWLRVCEAMALSDEPNEWHNRLREAYGYVCVDSYGRYDDVPTMLQVQEAEERLAGLSTLLEVCLSFERVATFEDWGRLDVKALYTQESDKIRAKHKTREDDELYREVASELLEAQCTAGATLEQASAPEVAGLQARIKELEQALEESRQSLEASEAERAKLAEVLNEFAENEASGPSDVIKRVLMAKGVQGVYRLCRVLDKAKERGVITEVAGKLQWGSNTIVTNAQCAYMVARLNAEFYPKGNIRWSDWCRVIGGITAKSLSNSYHPRKTHAINIEGKGDIDELFDD